MKKYLYILKKHNKKVEKSDIWTPNFSNALIRLKNRITDLNYSIFQKSDYFIWFFKPNTGYFRSDIFDHP